MTPNELHYSSSAAKLLHHAGRLTHPLKPVTLQLALTDQCNLSCPFCSVKNREQNSLTPPQILGVLDHSVFNNVLGVEITGGGEPTLWPDLEELIGELSRRDKAIGLITNGILLTKRLSRRALESLMWLRVSLNCLDQVDAIDLSGLPGHVTLGFSYVVHSATTQAVVDKVAVYAARYGATYVRIVPDCLGPIRMRDDLDLDKPGFYIQTKTQRPLTPTAPCRMGFLKPYLNTDGFFYWCSGVCLETRRFPEEYRMGHCTQIAHIWNGRTPLDRQTPLDCHYPKCFWVEQNQILEYANTPIIHEGFV